MFASADSAQMDKVVDGGLVEDGPVDFATNTLVIITAPGNPHQVGSFADLTKPGLAVVTSPRRCRAGWPSGRSRRPPGSG